MRTPFGVVVIAILLFLLGVLGVAVGVQGLGVLSMPALAEAAAQTAWPLSLGTGILTILVAAGLLLGAGWAWWFTVIVLLVRLAIDTALLIRGVMQGELAAASLLGAAMTAVFLLYFLRSRVREAFGQ